MQKIKTLLIVIGSGILLSACGAPSHFMVRDADLASKIKKVVVLPFQNTNLRATEDPTYRKFKRQYTAKFIKKAKKGLSNRYEFISHDLMIKELQNSGFKVKVGKEEASGYTVPQAVHIGKTLGADAVFLGSVASYIEKPKYGITVRLLDVQTGKVLLAASSTCNKGMGSQSYNAPMNKLVKRFVKEAP